MPPRRAKASASTAAVPSAQKRRAEPEDASADAPPAKKARQSAPKVAPKKAVEVIDVSSDSEAGSDDGEASAVSSQKNTDGDSDDEGSNEDEGEEEDGMSQKVRERLDYIATHTDGLTSTYLKFITKELPNYMGKGGTNSDVAANIANHCAFQAQLGRSDLSDEKRLVKSVHRMCWGGCGESDDESEDSDDECDDSYVIPKEISDRVERCISILEGFDIKALRKVIKNLPKYKGRRNGEVEDLLEEVMDHLDGLAARKSDLVAEVAMIKKIQDEAASQAVK
ncbi:hypothetical protein DFH06DRAFT_6949 [Mycena polygramma]|nr:hypothetical protein DFH06DRAFT_6949 [Mycena polygramma]